MSRNSYESNTEAAKDTIQPILLLRVLDVPTLADAEVKYSYYFTDANETISFFDESGEDEAYLPVGITLGEVKVTNTLETQTINVTVDNVGREFCALAATMNLDGAEVHILRAFKNVLDGPEYAQMYAIGRISNYAMSESITAGVIEFSVTGAPMTTAFNIPRRMYWPNCNWIFKSNECGYPDSVEGWWVRWWLRTSSNYSTLDETADVDLDEIVRTVNYSNKNPSSQADYYNCVAIADATPKYSETYTLSCAHDDGVRIYINDVLKINAWTSGSATHTCTVVAVAATAIRIRIEYFENTSTQTLGLNWSSASQASEKIGATAGTVKPPADATGLGLMTCSRDLTNCKAHFNYRRFGGFPHLLKSRDPSRVWTKS